MIVRMLVHVCTRVLLYMCLTDAVTRGTGNAGVLQPFYGHLRVYVWWCLHTCVHTYTCVWQILRLEEVELLVLGSLHVHDYVCWWCLHTCVQACLIVMSLRHPVHIAGNLNQSGLNLLQITQLCGLCCIEEIRNHSQTSLLWQFLPITAVSMQFSLLPGKKK